jgi:nucleotide-binding universal stress UspA family protein
LEEADVPGITVGVDGSGHSKRALEEAAKEAGIHHAPRPESVTVKAVHGSPAEELINASRDVQAVESSRSLDCAFGRSGH